jgi:hypothetical protein
LAADGAGFSRIAHGQYAIFIALRGCDESEDVSDDQKMPKSCLKSSKRTKKKPKIRKMVNN